MGARLEGPGIDFGRTKLRTTFFGSSLGMPPVKILLGIHGNYIYSYLFLTLGIYKILKINEIIIEINIVLNFVGTLSSRYK